ncbi:putative StAR-related lipid transfer protein 5 [Hypsibius exemplaris]|uniref:StAR-related lipid transfer protein 5 n=1 Tax=Hypsibius exemplaris TaxID=2072580 RepID=A0A9X6NLT3_HYPEX|nr:putative StAR-related lipid transfer protein 5 [Hypsibius exemplaris]
MAQTGSGSRFTARKPSASATEAIEGVLTSKMVAENAAFIEKATDVEKRIRELESLREGWKKVKETPHCSVYSRPSDDFSGHIYKSEGNVPAPFETVFNFVYPGVEKPRRREWDTAVSSTVVIDKPATDTDVLISRTAPVCMGLISAREFVDLVKVVREPTRIFTASCSIDHPAAPETKGFVRGFNYPNSLFCYKVEGVPHETRFVQYVQSDLRGMLPSSLVESAIPSSMAEAYPNLKAALAKEVKEWAL